MNLFEHNLRVHVRSYKADKKQVEKDGPLQSTAQIGLRIMEERQFGQVVATIRDCKKKEAEDWIENLFGLQSGRLDGEYHDHRATFHTDKQLGVVENCIVNAFDIDHEDLGITFKMLCYGVSKTLHGELAASVGEKITVKIKRGKHWKEQEDLPLTEGDDAAQEEIAA